MAADILVLLLVFVFIVFLFPTLQTAIADANITGNAATILNVIPWIFLLATISFIGYNMTRRHK